MFYFTTQRGIALDFCTTIMWPRGMCYRSSADKYQHFVVWISHAIDEKQTWQCSGRLARCFVCEQWKCRMRIELHNDSTTRNNLMFEETRGFPIFYYLPIIVQDLTVCVSATLVILILVWLLFGNSINIYLLFKRQTTYWIGYLKKSKL